MEKMAFYLQDYILDKVSFKKLMIIWMNHIAAYHNFFSQIRQNFSP